MNKKNTASVDDLIWAREMLRTFARLEKLLRKDLGPRGIDKTVFRNPIMIAMLGMSFLISLIGVYFWVDEKKVFYLSTLSLPLVSIAFIYHNIVQEKKKNIFRWLAKLPDPPESLILIIEDHVFNYREQLEEIIAWRVNMFEANLPPQEVQRFGKMFDARTWENMETAQSQCTILAILMVTLQRFLHDNKDIYNEHVKKLPLMNAGYNYKPSKQKKHLEATDIQTFGGGFTTEDLFTGGK